MNDKTSDNKVLEHARCFADQHDQLTPELMIQRHEELGISGSKLKSSAIISLLKRNKCPYTASAIAGITNPAATGIWNPSGTFNEQKFQELAQKAVKDDLGRPSITRDMFNDMIGVNPGSNDTAAYAYILSVIPYPLSWSKISNASVDEIFKYFSNTSVDKKPAVTVEHLRTFYTNPSKFLQFIKK
jgi:hypothetical protein